MSNEPGTLHALGRHLALALRPLSEALADPARFRQLMHRLGWVTAAGIPPSYAKLGAAVNEALDRVAAMGDSPKPAQVAQLVKAVADAFQAAASLSAAPPDVDAGAFTAEIGERLVELLLTDYLAAQLPAAFNVLSALNVVDLVPVPAAGGRPSFARIVFQWSELPRAISEPQTLPKRVYGWGTPDFRFDRVVDHLSELFCALRFPVQIPQPDEELVRGYAGLEDAPFVELAPSLVVPFYYLTIAGKPLQAAFALRDLPAAGGKPPGVVLEPQIPSEFPLTLNLAPGIDLRLRAGTNAASTLGIVIRPGEIGVKYPFQPGTPPPSAGVGVGFDFAPAKPALLLGSPGATRLELGGGSIDLGAQVEGGQFQALLGARLKGLALVLQAGEGDGFIQKILGSGSARVDVPLGFEWSSRHGIRFDGSGAFEVMLHPHLALGPISVDELAIRLSVPPKRPPDLRLELGAGISGTLGPLSFVVRGIGLGAYATFAKGNLGPMDLALGFKPPSGVGLSIDAAVVKGGGFLDFRPEMGEYDGAIELTLIGFLSLKAIGLISTRMPDGKPGFSLLIVITAEFGTGIQLGFGFTLLGVGGILGLHRSMALDALVAGVRTGGVAGIMFPKDVIKNAPRIISDLRTFFPPREGTFVIGPMAKVAWGTPPLITLSLAVVVEIPGNVAIIGVLRVALPDEKAALLVLQVSFIAALEFDRKRVWLFGSLFESRVLFMSIEGELGVLAAFGDDANFVVSVGGFHPRFTPPPLPFPAPRRVAVDLVKNPVQHVRVEGYFAVTTNTAQFGARAELFYGLDAFNVHGHIGFDALFQFSPFYFIIEVSASFGVDVFGIGAFSVSVQMSLEGPSRWRARGTGTLELLFFDISVDFDVSWGEHRDTSLPPIKVMERVHAELGKAESWAARLPAGNNLSVTLRTLPAGEAALVLHPLGVLRVSQRAVPLALALDKVGNQRPEDARRLELKVVEAAGMQKVGTVPERFAPGQFQDIPDADRMSRPAYQALDGGVEISAEGAQLRSARATRRTVRYEQIVIDNAGLQILKHFFQVAGALFNALLRGGSVSKNPLSQVQKTLLQPYDQTVKVGPESYVVALQSNNTALSAQAAFASEAAARDFMKARVAADPAAADTLHVIPAYEMAA